ncbi:dipeptidyl peptidase 9-like isoform X2 [Ciona intestinalis]
MSAADIEESITPGSVDYKGKSAWQEIRHCVRSSRKIHSQFAQKVPHDFTFVLNNTDTDQNERTGTEFSENKVSRLFFLGVLQGQRENTLLYVDIPNTTTNLALDKPAEWNSAFGYFQPNLQTDKYSKEEELLRERKRVSVHGITSYHISSNNQVLMFPSTGSIYTIRIEDLGRVESKYSIRSGMFVMNYAVEPKHVDTSCEHSRMDPKFSPTDPNLISFIHDNDIWVTHTGSGCERRLTHFHKGCKNKTDNYLSAGIASYIVQEEFERYTGYWWQPNNPAGVHRILYELVDESEVEILQISNPVGQPSCDSYRYPTPGSPNARVTLQLVEFTTTGNGEIQNLVTRKLSEPLHEIFPWLEYIVRISWMPSGKGVWAQLLDRKQQKTAVVYIPLSRFTHSSSGGCVELSYPAEGVGNGVDIEMIDDTPTTTLSSLYSNVKILYEETSDVWINVHDTIYFFKDNLPDEVRFIWASEHTGHRHLYLISSQLKQPCSSKRHSTGDLVSGDSRYCVCTVTPLTCGEWVVLGHSDSLWVNEDTQQVYFMSLKDSPLESHLYKVSYTNPQEPVRLTQFGYSHAVSMSKGCEQYVSVSSNIHELYSAKIFQCSSQPEVLVNLLDSSCVPDYTPPQLFSFTNSSGDQIHGLYHEPNNLDVSKKYPTVLYVYGGPHVQLVTNSFKGLRYQRLYTLSLLGYVVVIIDGRGSAHRGLKFEGYLKNKMGKVEMDDQVEGLQYLSHKLNYMDLTRVAIHGWSYGGYLSLMGLAQRPDIFKVAIAGAPVVNWTKYDTGYTERYMGTPDANPDAYDEGSVTRCADSFPNEPNRLLIVHGLIDENVHFVHTTDLISALVKCCKPYQLQIYPGERHGIRNPDSNEHFEVVVISFLQQHL